MTVLFFVDRAHLIMQIVIFLDVVFVRLVTCDKDDVLILATEGDLGTKRVTRWMAHRLMAHIPRLIDLPNVNALLRLRTQSCQKLVILRAESH